jgi:hypothetical protein
MLKRKSLFLAWNGIVYQNFNFLILLFSDGKEQAMTPFPHWVEGQELVPPPQSLPRLGDPGVKTR